MIYKGKEINDHCYEWKNQVIESLYDNSQRFTLEVIKDWEELIIKKTEELKSSGVDFKDVTIGIIGDGFHCCVDGPYMEIYLEWQELETDEEREKRIERKKRWIDKDIEDEKRREEAKKLAEQKEIERSIERLRNAGYQVI